MADYTEIDVNTLLPGEPVTSAIMLAFEENPRAIAEGATGAPKIADKIVSGAGTTTVSGLDDFGGMIIRGAGTDSDSGQASKSFQIQYSTDGGSTFSSLQTLATATSGIGNDGRLLLFAEIYINFSNGGYRGFQHVSSFSTGGASFSSGQLTGTVTGLTGDVTNIRLTGFNALLINPQGGDTAS